MDPAALDQLPNQPGDFLPADIPVSRGWLPEVISPPGAEVPVIWDALQDYGGNTIQVELGNTDEGTTVTGQGG